MNTYRVITQDEWDYLTTEGNVSVSDTIIAACDIDATAGYVGDLNITIEDGAHLTALSDASSWYTLKSSSLTLVWNYDDNATVQADKDDGGDITVTLVGYPSDVEPYVSTSSTGSVFFKRVDRRDSASAVNAPAHYTWTGDALTRAGAPARSAYLQSWDLLDALFPNNPHLWNARKYLTRYGRKGDSSKRVEDLRKAVAYLERAIKAEERNAS